MLFRKDEGSQSSDNLVAFPAGRLGVGEALARMRLLRIPVLAHEGVRVLLLVEVAEGVVDLTTLILRIKIRMNHFLPLCASIRLRELSPVSRALEMYWDTAYCKEEDRAWFGYPQASSSSR
jgi:hypothetical protein